MSQENALNTGQQSITHTDTSKIFVFDNRYDNFEYNNSSYVDENLYAGQLMGEIAATRKIVPLDPNASDGSQLPIGVLANDHVVSGGETKSVSLCVAGDVVENKIRLEPGVHLTDVVDGRTLRSRMGTDTVGIKLVGSQDLTNYDNE